MNESCRIIHVLTNDTLCAEEKHRRDLRPLFKRRERVNMEVVDIVWRVIPVRVLHISAIRTVNGLWMTNYTVIDGKGREHKLSELALLKVNPKRPHDDYMDMLCAEDRHIVRHQGEPLPGADFEEETGPVMEEKRPWWKRMKLWNDDPQEAQDDDTLSEREGEDKRTREEREGL